MAPGNARILVLEDDALLALDMADALIGGGYEVLGPALSVDDALALLAQGRCDAAVLDVKLGRETSAAVAALLRQQAVPCLAVSGYEQLPSEFDGVPRLMKPVEHARLLQTLRALLQTSGAP